jgi:peptidoglycan/xylan/chitin deacetylase (PgdA/CDA1 family)
MRRLRWTAKKAARHAFALGGVLSGALAVREALPFAPEVRALTYHRLGVEGRDAFIVAPASFEAQMRSLAQRKLAISLDQLLAFVAGRASIPRGACVVTIDDGLLSTYTEALPVLRRWGVPAVAFVSAGLVGCAQRYPERYMTWDHVRELAASGLVAIGSHAYTHRSLGRLDRDELAYEAKASRERIESEIGRPVRAFAYPYGMRPDFDRATDRVIADAGYTIAFNSMHGAISAGMDPISLPRVKIEGGESLLMFGLARRGAMDAWRAVDQTLWHLQQPTDEA